MVDRSYKKSAITMLGHTPLATKALSAVKWSYAGNATRAISQFLIGILLARLLGPTAYGTIAIAWIIIGLGKLVADFGLGAALIQRRDLDERDIGFVLAVQVVIGGGLTLAGWLASSPLAAFFNEPGVAAVMRAMSLLFLVQAIGQVGTSLLSRELRFKEIQLSGISTYLFGYLGVGLPLALMGSGVWSLVAAQMSQAVLFALVMIWLSGTRMRFSLRPKTSGMFRFGRKVIGANIASWILLNVDSLLVGRAFGATELGLYNRAMTLVATPTGTIAASAQPVLFSGCSRLNGDSQRVLQVYLAVTGALSLIVIPVFLVIAAIPKTVVSAVYGEAWGEAARILPPLCLAMPAYALLSVVGPVLMAIDKVGLEARAQWVALAISVPVLAAAASHSLVALAWAVLLSYLVRLLLLMLALQRGIRFSWAQWAQAVAPSVRLALIVGIPTFIVDGLFASVEFPLRLGFDVLVASVLSVFAVRLIGPTIRPTLLGLSVGDRIPLPSALLRWMRLGDLA